MIIIADDGKERGTVDIFNYIHTILVSPYINISIVSLTLSWPPWWSFRMPSRASLESHANRDTKCWEPDLELKLYFGVDVRLFLCSIKRKGTFSFEPP